MLLMIVMVKKLLELFMKKNCRRLIKEFSIEKVIKRKGNKQYTKLKGFDNSFKSRTDKKRHCMKWLNTFLNHIDILEETLMLKLIYLIMKQKLI